MTVLKRLARLPLCVAACFAGCVESPSAPTVGSEIRLKLGETAVLRDPALRLTFVDVPSDSRCPSEVECVWAGDATVSVSAAVPAVPPLPLELHTHAPSGDEAVYGEFRVRLAALAPYPRRNARIDRAAYVATLAVTRR